MIQLLIFTDDFEEWIEKIEASVKVDWSRGKSIIRKDEVRLVDKNYLFVFILMKNWHESQRGRCAHTIIYDKYLGQEKEWGSRAMLGHTSSVCRTDKYYRERENKKV